MNINHTWIKIHQFEITIKIKLSNIIKHPWPCYLGGTNSAEVVRIKLHSTDFLFQSFKNLTSGSNNTTANFLSTRYQAFQTCLKANNFFNNESYSSRKVICPKTWGFKVISNTTEHDDTVGTNCNQCRNTISYLHITNNQICHRFLISYWWYCMQ